MTRRIMIVVTHLLGSGHLARALVLGRAFAEAGHDAHVVSGGFPVAQLSRDNVTFHQLPPLRSDGVNFTRLLDADGNDVSQEAREERQNHLLNIFQDLQPDILITELFPFGRRTLRAEFIALLEAANQTSPRPKIFCSIRDIIEPPSKPQKREFADEMIARFFDGVLVHADETVVTLDQSWPTSDATRAKLRYTGFVAPALPDATTTDGEGEIIVSTGGSDAGDAIFETAARAAHHSTDMWRMLVAGPDAEARISKFQAIAPQNMIVEPARPDFRTMLRHAAASINMCGYNTCMDILQIGLPSVMIPHEQGGEAEQSLRATALNKMSGLACLRLPELTPERLLAALAQVRAAPPRDTSDIGFEGGAEAVRLCLDGVR